MKNLPLISNVLAGKPNSCECTYLETFLQYLQSSECTQGTMAIFPKIQLVKVKLHDL